MMLAFLQALIGVVFLVASVGVVYFGWICLERLYAAHRRGLARVRRSRR